MSQSIPNSKKIFKKSGTGLMALKGMEDWGQVISPRCQGDAVTDKKTGGQKNRRDGSNDSRLCISPLCMISRTIPFIIARELFQNRINVDNPFPVTCSSL